MRFSESGYRLLRPVIAFAMAVLLVFSAAESFACGLEDLQQSHLAFTPDDGANGHETAGDVCIHGHCHHGAAALSAVVMTASLLDGPAGRIALPDIPLLSRSIATLDRPPKRA